jgi:hypothetical protein
VRQKNSFLIALVVLLSVAGFQAAQAQQKTQQIKKIIQLSGIVIEDDSVTGGRPMPGVHVYVPKAGRGTTTNGVGFFSMPVLVNDEVVVSLVGYKRQTFVVPQNSPEYQTIVVTLMPDTVTLPVITIIPFPTEEVFKEAVLALNIPTNDQSIDQKNLNEELLALMLKTTPMDGYLNQRYYLDQWAASQNSRFQPVTNPFLNPFNWAKFFSGLKKNKKK